MSARIETMECFPRPINFPGAKEWPAPEAAHERCSGGYTQPGLIGGWTCPCECHQAPGPGAQEATDAR